MYTSAEFHYPRVSGIARSERCNNSYHPYLPMSSLCQRFPNNLMPPAKLKLTMKLHILIRNENRVGAQLLLCPGLESNTQEKLIAHKVNLSVAGVLWTEFNPGREEKILPNRRSRYHKIS